MSDNEKYSNNYDSDDEEYYKQLNVERKNKYKERYSSSTPSKEYTPKKHTTPIKSTPIKKHTTPSKPHTPIKKHTPIKSVNINKGAYNRLKEFLNIHNYILINSYSLNDNECIFIKVYDNINSNFIIITIPDTYNIISEGYNIKLEYIEDIHKIPTTNNNGYKSIKDENLIDENEYLDDEKINKLLNGDNYTNLDITTQSHNILYDEIQNISTQLNRLKNCVSELKYKICIETDNVLCILNNKNKLKCYKLPENNKNNNDEDYINYKKMYITTNINNFYENIKSINKDLYKLQEKLYNIIDEAHNNQVDIIKIHIKKFNNIKEMLDKYKNHKLKINNKIISISNKILQLSKKQKQLESAVKLSDNVNKFNVNENLNDTTIKSELITVKELKSTAMEILVNLKNSYDNFILNFENVLIENIQLIQKINNNFELIFN